MKYILFFLIIVYNAALYAANYNITLANNLDHAVFVKVIGEYGWTCQCNKVKVEAHTLMPVCHIPIIPVLYGRHISQRFEKGKIFITSTVDENSLATIEYKMMTQRLTHTINFPKLLDSSLPKITFFLAGPCYDKECNENENGELYILLDKYPNIIQ